MTAMTLTSDDRLSQATQLQLTWWRFRRHKLAVVSLAVVALFYLGAVFADFLAVADPHATDARRSFIPPQGISLFDDGAEEDNSQKSAKACLHCLPVDSRVLQSVAPAGRPVQGACPSLAGSHPPPSA